MRKNKSEWFYIIILLIPTVWLYSLTSYLYLPGGLMADDGYPYGYESSTNDNEEYPAVQVVSCHPLANVEFLHTHISQYAFVRTPMQFIGACMLAMNWPTFICPAPEGFNASDKEKDGIPGMKELEGSYVISLLGTRLRSVIPNVLNERFYLVMYEYRDGKISSGHVFVQAKAILIENLSIVKRAYESIRPWKNGPMYRAFCWLRECINDELNAVNIVATANFIRVGDFAQPHEIGEGAVKFETQRT